MKLTESELLQELREVYAQSDDPEGYYTLAELCELLGLGKEAVRRRLKLLSSSNQLLTRRVRRTSIAGITMPVPAYAVRPSPDGS